MTDLPTTARQILGNITMGQPFGSPQPFQNAGAGQFGNAVVNGAAQAGNFMLGQGVTAPVSDIVKIALAKMQGKQLGYNDLNSGAAKFGVNAFQGINNNPQEMMNNLYQGVGPASMVGLSLLGGGGASTIASQARNALNGQWMGQAPQMLNAAWKAGLK